MISFEVKGDYSKTRAYLQRLNRGSYLSHLNEFGAQGVAALASATPVESGETANSWYYEVNKTSNGYEIVWKNSHINNGVNIAVILQMGHGTRNGGYVQGRDYINPAIRPIFDAITANAWKELIRDA